MRLGEEIGRGVRSIVYGYGVGEVAKVPNPDVPAAWLAEEVRLTDIVEACGAVVPRRRRIEEIDGTEMMVTERIMGESMLLRTLAEPDGASDLGRRLAEIQIELSRVRVSFALPDQHDRLVSKIRRTALRHGEMWMDALDLVPDDDAAPVVCHGDLHPRNVIMTEERDVIVDWFDTSRGQLAADVVRSLILLDDSIMDATDDAARLALTEFRRGYEESAMSLTGFERGDLAPWWLVQRIARLSEGIGLERRDAFAADLDAAISRR